MVSVGLKLRFLDFKAGLLAFMTTLRQNHTKYTVCLLIQVTFLFAFPELGNEGLMNLFTSPSHSQLPPSMTTSWYPIILTLR